MKETLKLFFQKNMNMKINLNFIVEKDTGQRKLKFVSINNYQEEQEKNI